MNCVILFRTHVWDDFVFRQYKMVKQNSPFEVIILANNTNGICPPINNLPFVTFCIADFEKMGLYIGDKSDCTWYNADYPLYYYFKLFNKYDYYIIWEYDVVVRANISVLMERVIKDFQDVVAFTVDDPFYDCDYIYSISGVYPKDTVEKTYFPFAVFSRRAVAELLSRRLYLSDQINSGKIKVWPHAELFMGTELKTSRLTVSQLTDYGAANFFSHYPPLFEGDIQTMVEEQFLHPVLDAKRYVNSIIRYEGRPGRYFNPTSLFHKTLRRFPFSLYKRDLYAALIKRATRVRKIANEKMNYILYNSFGS
ncbi:hypothetical protein GOB93_20510 [Acetobacter musti]|uniref:DUF5672 domain-containing protein n=1 Tax=Acetobacter musti TaxID=864732 RepID=A0ABX0JVC3_9PROT|nr:hypothetical protein [Acetobacter musti]NHN86940.1 hypothetical protein [Acetobacter musti]